MTTRPQTTALLAALSVALFFSGFLVFLTPLPLAYLALKNQKSFRTIGLFSLLFVAIIYAGGLKLFVPVYDRYPFLAWLLPMPAIGLIEFLPPFIVTGIGFCYFLFNISSSGAVADLLKNPQESGHILLRRFVPLIACLVLLAIAAWPHSTEFLTSYRSSVHVTLIDSLKILDSNPGVDAVEVAELRAAAESWSDTIAALLPFFVTALGAFFLATNLAIARRLFFVSSPEIQLVRRGAYRLPFFGVWLTIILIAGLLLNVRFGHNTIAHFAILNLFLVAGLAYFFQGIAIITYLLDEKRVFGFLRFIILIFLISFIQISALVLTIIGFFDSWWDIRARISVTKSDKE